MKKMKKLTSLLLVLVMSLALAVPAFAVGIYQKSIPVPRSSDGYTFSVWTEFIYNGYEYRATANSEAQGATPPSGYEVKITARLCDSSGKVLKEKTVSGSGAYAMASTNGIADPASYAAKGEVSYNGNRRTIPGVTMNGAAFSKSRAFQELLGNANGYSVNSKGETYGSTMLAEVVGYEPDLISAVGVDGVEGYIRYDDVRPDTYRVGEIPLYDQEGIVIGTFIND